MYVFIGFYMYVLIKIDDCMPLSDLNMIYWGANIFPDRALAPSIPPLGDATALR